MFLSSINRFIKIELKYLEVIKWNCCNKSFRKQKEVWERVAQWKSMYWAIGSIPGIAKSKQTGRGTPMNLTLSCEDSSSAPCPHQALALPSCCVHSAMMALHSFWCSSEVPWPLCWEWNPRSPRLQHLKFP